MLIGEISIRGVWRKVTIIDFISNNNHVCAVYLDNKGQLGHSNILNFRDVRNID